MGLTLLINSSALALYSARFSLRCAFRSWCSPSRTCPSYLTLPCSSSVRDWLLLLQLLALDPGALLVDEDEQALPVVIVEQDSVAAQGTQSRFATEDLYFDKGCQSATFALLRLKGVAVDLRFGFGSGCLVLLLGSLALLLDQ